MGAGIQALSLFDATFHFIGNHGGSWKGEPNASSWPTHAFWRSSRAPIRTISTLVQGVTAGSACGRSRLVFSTVVEHRIGDLRVIGLGVMDGREKLAVEVD